MNNTFCCAVLAIKLKNKNTRHLDEERFFMLFFINKGLSLFISFGNNIVICMKYLLHGLCVFYLFSALCP